MNETWDKSEFRKSFVKLTYLSIYVSIYIYIWLTWTDMKEEDENEDGG